MYLCAQVCATKKYMNKIKKIPYGMTDLETIIREGYYYVDKTSFIPKLEDEGRYIIFLRPRRYGKSMTIAMLEYYDGLQYAERLKAFSAIYILVRILPRSATHILS